MPEKNYIGMRFGTRVCTGVVRTKWLITLELKCDCGLTSRATRYRAERHGCASCAKKQHGYRPKGKHTPEYSSWRQMNARCNNPRHHAYKLYGGRGITVCPRWNCFSNFLEDMGERPVGTSLDRIDVNRGYEKDNCRWATAMEQGRNKRTAVMIERGGQVKCLSEWIVVLGLTPGIVAYRRRKGWPLERWLEPRQ